MGSVHSNGHAVSFSSFPLLLLMIYFASLQNLKYKDQILNVFTQLLNGAYAEKTYSMSANFLSLLIFYQTSTYTLTTRFVNLEEWQSEGEVKLTVLRQLPD